MRIIKNSILIIITTVLCFSCKSEDRIPFIGNWEFTKLHFVEGITENSVDYQGFKASIFFSADSNFLLYIDNDFDFLNLHQFFEDTFENRNGKVVYGIWQPFNNKNNFYELIIQNKKNARPILIEIGELTLKKMIFRADNGTEMVYEFQRNDYNDITKVTYNFIDRKLNQWRIPSPTKETKEQIKARVINSLEFAIAYCNYYKKLDIPFTGLNFTHPIPLLFAKNGIRFQKDPQWESIFYDINDAYDGYNLLRRCIHKSAPIPDELENSKEIAIHILEEMKKAAIEDPMVAE